MRFKLYTDGGLRRDGFYFDNFKIRGISENLNFSETEQINSYIYPNPAENYLNIQSNTNINKLEIYNILGQKILEKSDENILELKTTILNAGIYIVKLYSDLGIESHRIIKK